MKKLFLVLCLLCSSAFALDSPLRVAGNCVQQMEQSVCFTQTSPTPPAASEKIALSGVGYVSKKAYWDYLELLDPANPTDTAMCVFGWQMMTGAPGGDHDKIARALWTPRDGDEVKEFNPQSIADAAIAKATEKLEQAAAAVSVVLLAGLMATIARLFRRPKKGEPCQP